MWDAYFVEIPNLGVQTLLSKTFSFYASYKSFLQTKQKDCFFLEESIFYLFYRSIVGGGGF